MVLDIQEVEFRAFPKIPRLMREIIITEKIDGTNAAVVITDSGVYAQSRSRFVTPGDDNHGFAKWVYANQELLCEHLGVGTHFGEWWGLGINRGYGATQKCFSPFNSDRWNAETLAPLLRIGVRPVPVIFAGTFSSYAIEASLDSLRQCGSMLMPFMNPEGVVVYHTAARSYFKCTIEKDFEPKGMN